MLAKTPNLADPLSKTPEKLHSGECATYILLLSISDQTLNLQLLTYIKQTHSSKLVFVLDKHR